MASTAKRTARSVLLTSFEAPPGTPLLAAQDHGNIRRYLAQRNPPKTLPDMIVVAVMPSGTSWKIDVWECPDER